MAFPVALNQSLFSILPLMIRENALLPSFIVLLLALMEASSPVTVTAFDGCHHSLRVGPNGREGGPSLSPLFHLFSENFFALHFTPLS